MKLDPKILVMIIAVLFLAMWGGNVPPNPPGPGPDPIPDPDAVITADGLHVLIVEETADRGRIDAAQFNALFRARMWCRANGAEFRQWDEEIDNQEEDPFWAKAMALPREPGLWLVVANETKGFSGPFPQDWEATEALLEEFD